MAGGAVVTEGQDSASTRGDTSGVAFEHSSATGAGRASRVEQGLAGRVIKRSLDIIMASALLLLALPLYIVIALAIKLAEGGPVFFAQSRIGRHGQSFTLVKFRTMSNGTHEAVTADAEQWDAYVAAGYKLPPDDDRITPIGQLLRKSSLDELPQLINVLVGQMSLVGIRPLVRDEFAARAPSDRADYLALRPGLTGLWQVAGRSRVASTTRIELDREYARTCGFATDVKILIRTPLAVLRLNDAH
jgi:exopolysaccharide production protein ExoY